MGYMAARIQGMAQDVASGYLLYQLLILTIVAQQHERIPATHWLSSIDASAGELQLIRSWRR